MKIHLLGPSGSGTTTLGKAISSALSIPHFDTDYFFWLPPTPPFTAIRPAPDRIELLRSTLENHESWVLSGSMLGWGDFLKPDLDLVIYKYVTQDIRIPRLLARERERYGNGIDFGNDMYQQHVEFIGWAKSYETGDLNMRSRASEEVWISTLHCKILRIENELTVPEELRLVLSQIKSF